MTVPETQSLCFAAVKLKLGTVGGGAFTLLSLSENEQGGMSFLKTK